MIWTRSFYAALAVGLISWSAASASRAATIFATADRDTAILQQFPNSNFGGTLPAVGAFLGGPERTILSFGQNLATQIGASPVIITSVDLLLMPDAPLTTIPGGGSLTPQVFALTSANSDWVEGTNTDSGQSPTGLSTWNNKVDPATPWAGGTPGASIPVTDYTGLGGSGTAPWGSATLTSVTTGTAVDIHFSGTSTQLTALIEGMISAGASSAGFILFDPNHTTDSNARLVVFSREDETASNRPMLDVTFVPVPEPGSFGLLLGGTVAMLGLRRIRNAKSTLVVRSSERS